MSVAALLVTALLLGGMVPSSFGFQAHDQGNTARFKGLHALSVAVGLARIAVNGHVLTRFL